MKITDLSPDERADMEEVAANLRAAIKKQRALAERLQRHQGELEEVDTENDALRNSGSVSRKAAATLSAAATHRGMLLERIEADSRKLAQDGQTLASGVLNLAPRIQKVARKVVVETTNEVTTALAPYFSRLDSARMHAEQTEAVTFASGFIGNLSNFLDIGKPSAVLAEAERLLKVTTQILEGSELLTFSGCDAEAAAPSGSK